MRNDLFIEALLIETGAFGDLEEPKLLASGEIANFYVHAEKLCQDEGRWEKFGDDPQDMIYHAMVIAQNDRKFQKVIERIASTVQSLKPLNQKQRFALAGGQTRDWIFSGPTAFEHNIPHFSIFKQQEGQEDRIQVLYPDGRVEENPPLDNYVVVQVVDLINTGSSIYSGKRKGTAPMLRNGGASIDHVVAVVTREQGGELKLIKQGIITHSHIAIDKRFLGNYSNNSEDALACKADPQEWGENYIRLNGADIFVKYFNPEDKKQSRAFKFLEKYEEVLKSTGNWQKLDAAVSERYGINFK